MGKIDEGLSLSEKLTAMKNTLIERYGLGVSMGKLFDEYIQVSQQLESAQKWIPVEEELPEVDLTDEWNTEKQISERVLVKESGIIYFGEYYHESGNWSVPGRLGNINVTHWRKIELT